MAAVVALWLVAACAPTAAPPPPALAASQPAKVEQATDDPWAKVVEAAKKEGKVNLYSYNLVGDIGLAVSRTFKERYGISVDIITGRGAEFMERIKTEKRLGSLVADLHDGSALHATNMRLAGFTIPLEGYLPALDNPAGWKANPWANDPANKHILGLATYAFSPWVNTKQVKPGEEPQEWKDLLTPQWKGRMMLTDPTTSGGPQQFFVPMMKAGVMDEAYIKALYKQELRFASSLQDEGLVLARGERSLSIRGSASQYSRMVVEGAPIKAIDMRDGVVAVVSPVMVVFAGGPHPNAARLFANWFISQEGLTTYGKAASLNPIRKDVADFSPGPARLTPQKPIIQTAEDLEQAAKLFRERWPDKLWGRG